MASWPASLPQKFLANALQVGLPDNRVVSQNDTGPAKMRRRSSLQPYVISGQMRMTLTQFVALRTFVETTLVSGVSPFTFPHPLDGTDTDVRFRSLPSVGAISGRHWVINIDLEALP